MEVYEKTVVMTREELKGLYEYSLSFPTGTTIGKRWKRNRNVCRVDKWKRPLLPIWDMAEYVEHSNPKLMGIKWRRVVVLDNTEKPPLGKPPTLKYFIYVLSGIDDEPIAAFAYGDMALKWVEENYPNNYRIERVL